MVRSWRMRRSLFNFGSEPPTDQLSDWCVFAGPSPPGAAVKNINVVSPIGGALPDGDSYPLAVSPEAGTRYVMYRSAASNLVVGDTNGKLDVFLFDRVANTTERVSVGVGGVEGNGDTVRAALSGNTVTMVWRRGMWRSCRRRRIWWRGIRTARRMCSCGIGWRGRRRWCRGRVGRVARWPMAIRLMCRCRITAGLWRFRRRRRIWWRATGTVRRMCSCGTWC